MADNVKMCIQKVKNEDVKTYYKYRIKHFYMAIESHGDKLTKAPSDFKIDQLANAFSDSILTRDEPKLAEPVDISKLPGDENLHKRGQRRYQKHYDCLIGSVESLFPTSADENIISDFVSYLDEDWGKYPVNSVVLRRETNLSVVFYVLPSIRVDLKNLKLTLHDLVTRQRSLAMYASSSSGDPDIMGASLSLATGLAGLSEEPYNVFATALITLIWPSQDSSAQMMQQVYAALQTIIKKENAKDHVESAIVNLKTVVQTININYTNAKDSGNSPSELLGMLSSNIEPLMRVDVMGYLQFGTDSSDFPDELAAETLSNFLLAGGTYLAILQEMAVQDKPEDSINSEYAKDVSSYSEVYADYADERAKYVKRLRMNQISSVETGQDAHLDPGTGDVWYTEYYYFTDSNVNYESFHFTKSSKYDVKAECQDARDSYAKEKSEYMDDLLDEQVYAVTKMWRELIANPLG